MPDMALPYVETDRGWFSTSYTLRSPSGDDLGSYGNVDDARDALVELLTRDNRGHGGFLAWL